MGSAVGLDLGRIFGAETGRRFRMNFFCSFVFCVFCVFFFEDGAADNRVGLRFRGGLFVLGFYKIGSQRVDLIVV